MNLRLVLLTMSATALYLSTGFAHSATTEESAMSNPAQACQLSIPAPDSKAKPKATGFVNGGTSPVYVICGFINPSTMSGGVERFTIGARSLTGQDVPITCTGVIGTIGDPSPWYVTKTLTARANGDSSPSWYPSDFGGTLTIPSSGSFSVTCALPPSVLISYTEALYLYEIGS